MAAEADIGMYDLERIGGSYASSLLLNRQRSWKRFSSAQRGDARNAVRHRTHHATIVNKLIRYCLWWSSAFYSLLAYMCGLCPWALALNWWTMQMSRQTEIRTHVKTSFVKLQAASTAQPVSYSLDLVTNDCIIKENTLVIITESLWTHRTAIARNTLILKFDNSYFYIFCYDFWYNNTKRCSKIWFIV